MNCRYNRAWRDCSLVFYGNLPGLEEMEVYVGDRS